MGVNSFQGNPYDGPMLGSSLQKVYHLTRIKVEQAFVDQGYKGHGIKETEILLSRQKRGVTKTLKRHLKEDNLLNLSLVTWNKMEK